MQAYLQHVSDGIDVLYSRSFAVSFVISDDVSRIIQHDTGLDQAQAVCHRRTTLTTNININIIISISTIIYIHLSANKSTNIL